MDNTLEYADSIGLDDDNFGYMTMLCKNNKEVDALNICLWKIDENRYLYLHSVLSRSKDPEGRQKAVDKLTSDSKSKQEIKDTLLEWEAFDPIRATTQEIVNDIFSFCKDQMKTSGMGRKKWLKLKPLLNNYLKRPLTQEERIEIRLSGWRIEQLTKSLNTK